MTGVKAVLGKKFHSEDVQKEIDLVGYKMVDVAGKVGIPVRRHLTPVARTLICGTCQRCARSCAGRFRLHVAAHPACWHRRAQIFGGRCEPGSI